MARLGTFSDDASAIGWVGRSLLAGGWFSAETFPDFEPLPLAVDATTISGIIDVVRAQLYAQLTADAAPAAPILPVVAFGESQIEVYLTRRVVFVPIRGQHTRTRMVGGEPGRLWNRDLGFEVHIRTESKEACDELCQDLVAAMHDCLSADAYDMTGEMWDGDEMTGPPGQQLMILLVTLRGSFRRSRSALVTPGSIPIDGGIQ